MSSFRSNSEIQQALFHRGISLDRSKSIVKILADSGCHSLEQLKALSSDALLERFPQDPFLVDAIVSWQSSLAFSSFRTKNVVFDLFFFRFLRRV
jgi:hypothetical protein